MRGLLLLLIHLLAVLARLAGPGGVRGLLRRTCCWSSNSWSPAAPGAGPRTSRRLSGSCWGCAPCSCRPPDYGKSPPQWGHRPCSSCTSAWFGARFELCSRRHARERDPGRVL